MSVCARACVHACLCVDRVCLDMCICVHVGVWMCARECVYACKRGCVVCVYETVWGSIGKRGGTPPLTSYIVHIRQLSKPPRVQLLQPAEHSGEIMPLAVALSNDWWVPVLAVSPRSPEGLNPRCPEWELPR